jgi:PII-like signaling protein
MSLIYGVVDNRKFVLVRSKTKITHIDNIPVLFELVDSEININNFQYKFDNNQMVYDIVDIQKFADNLIKSRLPLNYSPLKYVDIVTEITIF